MPEPQACIFVEGSSAHFFWNINLLTALARHS
jgi:hypothetical protein